MVMGENAIGLLVVAILEKVGALGSNLGNGREGSCKDPQEKRNNKDYV